jgi:dTDP-4-amino-4,6-dideoxygalactose transaminase
MIFFVDYFGIETRLGAALQDLLADKRIIIVKDASHSFLSLVNKGFSTDYKYDYLISSVYKNLPLQAGAIAIGNFDSSDDFISLSVILKRYIVLLVKNIIYIFGFGRFLSNRMSDISIVDEEKIFFSKGINISGSYKKLLSRLNLERILRNRGEITDKFNKYFSEKSGLRPVFCVEDINENILQDYPLYIENQEDRDRLLNMLAKNSIDAYTWPTFHRMNHSEHLWSKILVLPLNQKVLEVLKNV